MFDDSEQELGPVLALVLAIAILTSLFAIAVALSLTGMFSSAGAGTTTATPPVASAASIASSSASAETVAPTRIYFALDSADLPGDAGAALFTMAVAATVEPGRHLEVSGYHDASGDAAHNVELAKARAVAVRDALQSAGVPSERIDLQKPVEVLGGADPQEARRVEITLR